MTKEYIRTCDFCGKEIKNLYEYGVTTLYRNIRIGRGHSFHDYDESSLNNLMDNKTPNDFDNYGKGWKQDKDEEFSFCSPECVLKFLSKLYIDTYNNSINLIKKEKKETLDISFEEFKKKYNEKTSFFKKIQTIFSKNYFKEEAIKEADKLIKEIKELKKLGEEKQ